MPSEVALELVKKLSDEEQVDLCCGNNCWSTHALPHHGINTINMCDGPNGLRKVSDAKVDLAESTPATCFPAACVMASTWDRTCVQKAAVCIGRECLREDVHLLLGPGNNIKRSPLCGRNFEYYSEDPHLGGSLCTAFVKGAEEQGVGTTLKHFLANNQEGYRFTTNAIIDERTLREIYLAAFEGPVRDGKPRCVMCSYNMVNGEHVASSHHFLTEILREEWGFEGFVISDWGAVVNRSISLNAGLDLEMPGLGVAEACLLRDVRDGLASRDALATSAARMVDAAQRLASRKSGADLKLNMDEHHKAAQTVAEGGIVLLQNECGVLPISADVKVAVIGELAEKPRIQGGGSSHVRPTRVSIPLDEMRRIANDDCVAYARGYNLEEEGDEDAVVCSTEQRKLLDEAVALAERSSVALVFIGIPDKLESEGYDRQHLRLPAHHNALVEAVAAVNPHTVVILTMSSAVEMPWLSLVQGVVAAYLPGQAGGAAVASLLYGRANFSGKLAETFPLRLEDTPAYLHFPGPMDHSVYAEGIYVGYRHYDSRKMEVLFPFGHGLSYTTFEYGEVCITNNTNTITRNNTEICCVREDEVVTVSVVVRNTGPVAGAEVVQLYVSDVECSMGRPTQELKSFQKVVLEPGEEQKVSMQLVRRDFAFYSVAQHDWVVEEGEFVLRVGSSSRDIRGEVSVYVTPLHPPPPPTFTDFSTIGEVLDEPATAHFSSRLLREFPPNTSESMKQMMLGMTRYLPLRSLFVKGNPSPDAIKELITELNACVAAKYASS